jgi:zinc protease
MRKNLSSTLLAALALLAGTAADAQQARKATPPPPQAEKRIRFPAFEEKTLANGLRVVAIEHAETPAVSAQLILPAGKVYEPAAKAGLASATAELLTQGTQSRSAQDIAGAIDAVGGNLAASASSDAGVVAVQVTSDQLDLGLELLADVVLRPTFPQEEIERWRRQTLNALQIQQNDPGYMADTAFFRALFGAHPYGQPSAGTPESVRGLTRDDFTAFHQRQFVPNGAILAIVGDIRPADAFARAERAFGAWKKGEEPKAPAAPAGAGQRRIVVIDKPDAVQTQVRAGYLTIPYRDPALFAAEVYNSVAGGGSNSRLYEEVRRKRGLSYGAYSDFTPRRLAGSFIATTSTKTESTVEALEQVLGVLGALEQTPVPAEELSARKTFITGSFPLEIETPEGIADQVVEAMFYGLGRDFLEGYRDRIQAVSAADVQAFARRLDPRASTIVLVGNASGFAEELGRKYGKFETIPAAELDLLQADLRRPKDLAASAPVSGADRNRAREILGRVREAMGGKAFLEQRSQISKGTGTLTAPGMPQPMPLQSVVVYEVFPAKTRTELGLPMGQMIQAFDGQVGWVSMMGQVQEQTQQMSQDQYYGLNMLRTFDQAGYEVRPLADAEVDGKKVQVVAVSDPQGHTTRFSIDPENHRVVKTAFDTPGGTSETVYTDYRPVAGVQVAHTVTALQNGTPMVELKITEVQVNAAVDEALFKKPSS